MTPHMPGAMGRRDGLISIRRIDFHKRSFRFTGENAGVRDDAQAI
jgi:hypothetical protein